mmetsp:Transcript_35749/g.95013  ORF Transcript_35749/g.95013 Transcript_35749/m.95013 type:complete len:280 (+) Transcript_35749:796-1635(+)
MNRDAALGIECGIRLVDGTCDVVQLFHELFQRGLSDMLDEQGTCLVVDISWKISSASHQLGQVDHLPEHGHLERELHVVGCSTIKLKPHVLRPAVEALDVQVSILAPQTTAPQHVNNFVVGLQKEGARTLRRLPSRISVVVMHRSVLILDDHGLVIIKLDQGADLFDFVVGPRHKELLLSGKPQLSRACISHENGMLLVDLHSLLLATLQLLLVGTQENPGDTSNHTDISRVFILKLDILVNRQIYRSKDFAIKQFFLGARKDRLLPAVHRHLARHLVQ